MAGDLLIRYKGQILDIFKYSRTDDAGISYYLKADGTEITISDILSQLKLFPLKGDTSYEEVDSVWGVSIADIVQIYETEGKRQLDNWTIEKLYDQWKKFQKTEDVQQFVFGVGGSAWGQAIEQTIAKLNTAKPKYEASPEGMADFFESFYPSKAMIDYKKQPLNWENDLRDAALAYIQKKTGKTYTAESFAAAAHKSGTIEGDLATILAIWTQEIPQDLPSVVGNYPKAKDFYDMMKDYVNAPAYTPPITELTIEEQAEKLGIMIGQSKELFIAREKKLYVAKFGEEIGTNLFNWALQSAADFDLATEEGQTDFFTRYSPEDTMAALIPTDVSDVWESAGITMLSGLANLGEITPEATRAIRTNAYNQALEVLRQGNLPADQQERLREDVNDLAAYIETTEPKFILTEANAEQQYKLWLLQNIKEERVRNDAWAFFPNILSQYDESTGGRIGPTSEDNFQKYLDNLGTGFFENLSPKPMRVGGDMGGKSPSPPIAGEIRRRQPGGGRMPLGR